MRLPLLGTTRGQRQQAMAAAGMLLGDPLAGPNDST